MAIKIAVLGGKGGVGKTTVTANLSYALAGKSLRVAAVDSDTGLNCLNKAFRQPKPSVSYTHLTLPTIEPV